MKAALVVAHPDDEVMWFGGIVLTEPDDWTIICCSVPRADPERSWKFFDACDVLGAKARLLGCPEPPAHEPFKWELLNIIDLEGYDRIVTHGIEGGYGHVHHKSLHNYIHTKYSHKMIWTDCPPGKSDYTIDLSLSVAVAARKLTALKCYDHVLPYGGVAMTKWEALLKRYYSGAGWELDRERYRVAAPRQDANPRGLPAV